MGFNYELSWALWGCHCLAMGNSLLAIFVRTVCSISAWILGIMLLQPPACVAFRLPQKEQHDTEKVILHIDRMTFPLKFPRACNAVVIKLIDQENKMAEWSDIHDEPNIDATSIAFRGRQFLLPVGLHLDL